MHKTSSVIIPRDPATVFAWLIDGEHGGIFRFLFTMKSSGIRGRSGEGITFYQTRYQSVISIPTPLANSSQVTIRTTIPDFPPPAVAKGGSIKTTVVTITQIEPPHTLAMQTTFEHIQSEAHLLLTPLTEGTQLTIDFTVTGGPLLELFGLLFASKQHMEEINQEIAAAIEVETAA